MTRILTFLLLLAFLLPAHAQDLVGRATIIDGDTIEIHGQRIRLSGIDAPESSQICKDVQGDTYRCGQKSALALSDWIGEKPVHCVPEKKDRYGRTVATCDRDGQDLGEWLVSNGFAVAYRHYSDKYITAEAHARAAHAGIWTGSFEMPWDFRKNKQTPASSSSQCSKHDCKSMSSCEEAKFYLNTCHLTSLDRDHDGIPCESLCR